MVKDDVSPNVVIKLSVASASVPTSALDSWFPRQTEKVHLNSVKLGQFQATQPRHLSCPSPTSRNIFYFLHSLKAYW